VGGCGSGVGVRCELLVVHVHVHVYIYVYVFLVVGGVAEMGVSQNNVHVDGFLVVGRG
jgi:hypothetical protein